MRRVTAATLVAASSLALPAVPRAETAMPEEIVVTASRIPGGASGLAPVSIIGGADIAAAGYTSVADAIRLLPANTGSEFNLDPFTQNLSAGTASFNLRGLGLNATLVLINGRRQVVSGGVADDGSTFVDLNALMPLILLQRLEVVKDGAAALYGTDAVAGVANYMTRDSFSGVEARIENGTTTRSGQDDLTVSGLVGGGGDRWHAVTAASYLHRSALPATARAYTAGKAFSSFGQPGAFTLTAPSPIYPAVPVGASVIDPACGGPAGGIPNPRASQPAGLTGVKLGTCTFDFSSYYDLVPEEQRWNAAGTAHADLADAVTAFVEVGYAGDRVLRGTSPSFPLLNLVTVPATNPGNVFAAPALFTGRALGAAAGRDTVRHASDTWRGVAGARGTLGAWQWDLSGTYGANDFEVDLKDVLGDRFIAALNGRGGPNNTQFFNPFGSAVTARPGDPTYNDPAVIADFISANTQIFRSTLASLDGSVSGKLGNIGVAAGGQVRRETFSGTYTAAYNGQRFLFAVGGPNFVGARTVWALFGEARLPLFTGAEAQLAVRHEHGGAAFDHTDPKIALAYRPTDRLLLHGSFATSFRAPSVFQSSASQTVLENIVDPATQTTAYRGVHTVGTAALKPETATVATAGVTLTPMERLELSVDGWRYDYRDIIVKQSAQGIVLANPFDPRIIRQGGQIVRIDTSYVNASSAVTDGLDLAARFGQGAFTLGADATYIRRFVIQDTPATPPHDVAGNRNYNNFARSLPKWRGQIDAGWAEGLHALGASLRLIGRYRDDQNGNALIPGQATLDVHYTLRLPPRWGMASVPEITLGALNIADRDPPPLNTNAGYDSKVFDPRGRVIYLRVGAAW